MCRTVTKEKHKKINLQRKSNVFCHIKYLVTFLHIYTVRCCLVKHYLLFFDVGAKFQHILLASHFKLVREPKIFHLNLQERKEIRNVGHLEGKKKNTCCLKGHLLNHTISRCFWPQLIHVEARGMKKLGPCLPYARPEEGLGINQLQKWPFMTRHASTVVWTHKSNFNTVGNQSQKRKGFHN